MKTTSYFLIFALTLWLLGFAATYIIAHIIPLKLIMQHYLSYLAIIAFFILYAFIINYLFKLLNIEENLKNYSLIGFIVLILNLVLDITFVFPLFPEIKPFNYTLSYLGYSLMPITPIILYYIKSTKNHT